MLGALFGRRRLRCWVIKQIDDGLLHLCGRGTLVTDLKPREAAELLRNGQYRGGVRMGDSGIVLNSRLFAALVPEHTLQLDDLHRAHWRTRIWEVSRVPPRCWTWTGRLTCEPSPPDSLPRLVSTEDLTAVVRHVDPDRPPPGQVIFRAENELESPDDLRDKLDKDRRLRHKREDDWKDDDE